MTVAVAHIMSSKVVFAVPDHSVDHARELMAAKKIHALPVVGKNHMIMGIVTTADLARRIENDTPIRHVMSDTVVTVDATQSVGRAARLMREHHIHHMVLYAISTERNKTPIPQKNKQYIVLTHDVPYY